MYYSPDGITLDNLKEEINSQHISFCQRQNLVDVLEYRLPDQMKLYGYLIAQSLKDVNMAFEDAKKLYTKEKNTIFRIANSGNFFLSIIFIFSPIFGTIFHTLKFC